MCSSELMNRLNRYYDELKWLYCELYENQMPQFLQLCDRMNEWIDGVPLLPCAESNRR